MDLSQRPLFEVEVAVLDVETTGLSPPCGDRVVEIAVVTGGLEGEPECWSSLVYPEQPMDLGASEVNGITDEDLEGKPIFGAILADLRQRLEGRVIVAHNAPFDLGFLAAEYERAGEEFEAGVVFDTLSLARRCYHFGGNSLGNILRQLNIRNRDEHRALGDARATFEVYRRFAADLEASHPTVGDWLTAQGGPGWKRGPDAPELPEDHPLLEALREESAVRVRYTDGRGAVTERELVPLRISGLYLTAWCCLRAGERSFRVDRVEVLGSEDKGARDA
ncbi:MAG: exonuclease domain-containing protein [Planctomycetota bacterium]